MLIGSQTVYLKGIFLWKYIKMDLVEEEKASCLEIDLAWGFLIVVL
jgi:hypothetical protein